MTDAAWHALVIVSFLLVGVPSNVAVLWIHTRKNSRLAKNRFPLIFAALDLFALVTSLPFIHSAFGTNGKSASDNIYLNITYLFAINGYLLTLFMATIDKFYAVMFPLNYGRKRLMIYKSSIFITLVFNALLAIILATIVVNLGQLAYLIIRTVYSAVIFLMFLTIGVLYTIIITKLIRNQRISSKVKSSG